MDLKINIVQCHHKKSEFIKNEIIQPIHVGAALSNATLDYCIRDDDGENISLKNPNWCELTALYWQWKNVDADYYGLFHYRRIMTFTKHGGIEDNLQHSVQKKYNLLSQQIERECEGYDVLLPKKDKIYSFSNNQKNITLYEQYDLDHNLDDLDESFKIVKFKYPEIGDFIPQVKSLKSFYYGNIFLMKNEYYQDYCDFLFNVLFDLELKINIEEYDSYQSRVYGFISERLLNLYILYLINNKKIRFKEFGLLYLSQPRPLKIKLNTINKESSVKFVSDVNVCMAFDDNYFDHGMVVIKSMIENTKSSINLYILDGGGIDDYNKNRCLKEFCGNNINISFISVDNILLEKFPLTMGYISVSTYYRLLLTEIFPNFNKMIYIDSDVVVKGDIYDLWVVDLGDKIIGSCYDELGVYQERRIGFSSQLSYFNAGVMVFDIQGLRKKYLNLFNLYSDVFIKNKEKILFQDQDILNITHAEDVKIIDIKWNMGTGMFMLNVNDVKYSQKNIENSIDSPGIIHYTGGYKPWRFFSNHPLSYLYWFYFKKLNNKEWDFVKWFNFINNMYLRFGYRVNGDYINFHLFGKEFFRLKKKLLKKIGNNV